MVANVGRISVLFVIPYCLNITNCNNFNVSCFFKILFSLLLVLDYKNRANHRSLIEIKMYLVTCHMVIIPYSLATCAT